jgi:hypothetical protein
MQLRFRWCLPTNAGESLDVKVGALRRWEHDGQGEEQNRSRREMVEDLFCSHIPRYEMQMEKEKSRIRCGHTEWWGGCEKPQMDQLECSLRT